MRRGTNCLVQQPRKIEHTRECPRAGPYENRRVMFLPKTSFMVHGFIWYMVVLVNSLIVCCCIHGGRTTLEPGHLSLYRLSGPWCSLGEFGKNVSDYQNMLLTIPGKLQQGEVNGENLIRRVGDSWVARSGVR